MSDKTAIDTGKIKPLPFAWLNPAFGGDPRLQVGPTERAPVPTKGKTSSLKRVENALLAGERLSGTALYRARTELGFGRIKALDEEAKAKKWGAWWTISPSQALGIAELGKDKFELLNPSTWSLGGAARGTLAFATDIALDPLTWVTVGGSGLAKIGGKPALKIAGIAIGRRGAIEVGPRATTEIAEMIAKGTTRRVAEEDVMRRMAASDVVHAEMTQGGEQMIRFGTSTRNINIMRTTRITEPLGTAWRAAPYYETRSRAWDTANRLFGSRYYDLTQAMGKGIERTFQLSNRRRETDIALLTQQFMKITKRIPEGRMDVVRQAMENPKIELSAEEKGIRSELKKISDEFFAMQLEEGSVKKEQYIEMYLRHQPTEELQAFFRSEMAATGSPYAEKDIPEYTRKLWSSMHRTTEGNIDELNAMFRAKGVKKAFKTDLNEILAGYVRQHVQALESARLERALAEKYGRAAIPAIGSDISALTKFDIKTVSAREAAKSRFVSKYEKQLENVRAVMDIPRSPTKAVTKARESLAASQHKLEMLRQSTPTDVASYVAEYQAKHPLYKIVNRREVSKYYADIHNAEIAESVNWKKYLTPIHVVKTAEWMPGTQLTDIISATRKALTGDITKTNVAEALRPLREIIETEKQGLFSKKYTAAMKKVSDIEKTIANYRRAPVEAEARREWWKIHEPEFRTSTGEFENIEAYKTHVVGGLIHDISNLVPKKRFEDVRFTGHYALRDLSEVDKELQERWAKEYASNLFEDIKLRKQRAYTPEEISQVGEKYTRSKYGKKIASIEKSIETQKRILREDATKREASMVAAKSKEHLLEEQMAKLPEIEQWDVARAARREKLVSKAATKELKLEPTRQFGEEELYLYEMASGKQVYFPQPIAEELRKPMHRYITQAGGPLRPFEEKYIKWETALKKTLTVIWPAFFARNVQGGMFQNYLEGVGASDYYRSWDILMRTSDWKIARGIRKIAGISDTKLYDIPLMGKKTAREMRDIMEQQDVVNTVTGRIDVPLSEMQGKGATGTLSKGWNWLWNKYPETAMTGTEAMVRSPLFMHELYKGSTIEAAELAVGKTHFRYGAHELTDFENTAMKRLLPFWTWARWNIRRQTEMVIRKPGKYATLFKAQERVVSEDERNRMPDWMREKLGFATGKTFVGVDLPIGEMPGIYGMKDIAFGLSPMIKYPLGVVSGREFGTGRPVGGIIDIGFMLSSLLPRASYAKKELSKNVAGERPLSWTMAHQFGGVGVYEMRAGGNEEAYWSKIDRKPSWYPGKQKEYEALQTQQGWQPRLTEQGKFALSAQLGDVDIFGTPCNGQCVQKHIVPVKLGGSNTLNNMALVHPNNLHQFEEYMQPMAIERARNPTTLPDITAEDKYKFRVNMNEYMTNTEASMSLS